MSCANDITGPQFVYVRSADGQHSAELTVKVKNADPSVGGHWTRVSDGYALNDGVSGKYDSDETEFTLRIANVTPGDLTTYRFASGIKLKPCWASKDIGVSVGAVAADVCPSEIRNYGAQKVRLDGGVATFTVRFDWSGESTANESSVLGTWRMPSRSTHSFRMGESTDRIDGRYVTRFERSSRLLRLTWLTIANVTAADFGVYRLRLTVPGTECSTETSVRLSLKSDGGEMAGRRSVALLALTMVAAVAWSTGDC